MTGIPSVDGPRLIRILGRFGFELVRIKGSHHFIRHPDGRSTVVPVHGKEDIGKDYFTRSLRTAK